MAYSATARARRRCSYVFPSGHPRAGERCRAFAVWSGPGALDGSGRCAPHAGATRGPEDRTARGLKPYECRTAPRCACVAYPFPHRPGGGLCLWPDPPARRLSPRTANGVRTRHAPRVRYSPLVRNAPDVTPPGTPPRYAVTPTISGAVNPANLQLYAGNGWIGELAALLGKRR
jgi:hypothetical protein